MHASMRDADTDLAAFCAFISSAEMAENRFYSLSLAPINFHCKACLAFPLSIRAFCLDIRSYSKTCLGFGFQTTMSQSSCAL